MKIDFQTDTRIDIILPNGKTLCLLHYPSQDEITLISGGKGHRHVKEVQNRSDGHSSITLSKQQE